MLWFWIFGCFPGCFELHIKPRQSKYSQQQKKIWEWNKSRLLMDNKPQPLGAGTRTHTELKDLWSLRGFVLENKQDLPCQSHGQLFTQTIWLDVKGRFASGRTRGLDSMYCSLWLFFFSLQATWESISLFQLTWTILFQHYFLLF